MSIERALVIGILAIVFLVVFIILVGELDEESVILLRWP